MKVVDMHCDTISEIYLQRQSNQDISLKQNNLNISLEKAGKLYVRFILKKICWAL